MIELEEKLISENFVNLEYQECIKILKDKFKLDVEKKLEEPSEASLKFIVQLIIKIKDLYLHQPTNDYNLIALLKQCFQSLRNAASYSNSKQNYLIKSTEILDNAEYFIENLLIIPDNSNTDCIKMILQFLINVGINNTEIQIEIWQKFSEVLLELVKHSTLSFISVALIYNIISKNINLIPNTESFYEDILSAFEVEDADLFYYNQIVELLIVNNYFSSCYKNLKVNIRITLLEVLKNMLIEETKSVIPKSFIVLLSEQFKQKSDCILKTVTDYVDQIEPKEVALLLECLANASAKLTYQEILQEDKSLLINCIFLLKSVHSLGKNDLNNFSSIDKISKLSLVDETIEMHPGFGFKANLVRILGNLAWRHEVNQNELRELECIQLLLDCCKIDGRNPLIIQWSILTIRNILENNTRNQQVVKNMQLQGVVNSETLQEFGINLHCESDSKIGIIPLDAIKEQ